MLISRTPFRISLGGGSTDLPSYCRQYGGFIFGCAIDMYLDIFIRQPVIYDKIDLQYLKFESVDSIDELEHPIGREALKMTGIDSCISVYFKSDTPMGTGLGSSGSCAVGLLNALYTFKGIYKERAELAEGAFQITQNLNLPDGRQDPYLTALGGFVVLELGADDGVNWYRPDIKPKTINDFFGNSVLIYTGVRRESESILREQRETKALELKHRTKDIGREILKTFTSGNLDDFGPLMNEHWRIKKEMSGKISSSAFDEIYDVALHNGATGGKLIGAGGGGYFLFYCPGADSKNRLIRAIKNMNFKIINFGIDRQGTRVRAIDV